MAPSQTFEQFLTNENLSFSEDKTDDTGVDYDQWLINQNLTAAVDDPTSILGHGDEDIYQTTPRVGPTTTLEGEKHQYLDNLARKHGAPVNPHRGLSIWQRFIYSAQPNDDSKFDYLRNFYSADKINIEDDGSFVITDYDKKVTRERYLLLCMILHSKT